MGKAHSAIQRLAGETAIYGMSTILARVLNFLMVPLYTRVLTDQAEYGVVAEFMTYIAVLQVVLVLGLETGCFRFASMAAYKDRPGGADRVFSSALSMVGIFAALVCGACMLWHRPIAAALGYAGRAQCVVYVAGILLMDSVTAILFAKLRHQHKALRFAVIKTIKICCELGFNLLFFLVTPSFLAAHPDAFLGKFIAATPDFNTVLFSIFLSCVVCVLLFLPEFFRKGAYTVERNLLKQLLLYSLPLMIAGLPGILNDFSDRLLFRFLIPEEASWRAQMGVYQAGLKLAVLINLFIQMFKYAGEPFFFGESEKKDAPQTYAKVLDYFTGFCMLMYLGILMYLDVFERILGANYREGVIVVPVMALAYVLLGLYYNVSIWYKLSGKTTKFAVLITSVALVVTLLVNFLFLPRFGYIAAAWGHFASYAAMLLVCVLLGNKYHPIPYHWGKVLTYIGLGVALYLVSLLYDHWSIWPKLLLNTGLLFVYLVTWARMEHVGVGTLRKLRR